MNEGKSGEGGGMRLGYNVWFGLQHVTATGFRHSGRRDGCWKCKPERASPAEPCDESENPTGD